MNRRRVRVSVRTRAALVASATVLVALLVGGVALVRIVESHLIDADRTAARLRADDVLALSSADALPAHLSFPGEEDGATQVVDTTGAVLARTDNLEDHGAISRMRPEPGESGWEIRPIEAIDDEQSYVLVAVRSEKDPRVVAYAASSLERTEETVATLRRSLLSGLPLLVLLVGVTTWFLVRRALRPVAAITEEVSDITAQGLSRRVPEPATSDEIEELAITMNRMLERLEAASIREQRFIADASHELRSPLASARTTLEVASLHPGSRQDLLAAIDDALIDHDRLDRLTLDLLSLAKLAQPGSPTTAAPLDVDRLIGDLVDRRPEGSIDTDLRAGTVPVDGEALTQVLTNLLDNAARYRAHRTGVSAVAAPDELVICIDDDGPGIPVEDRRRVFEPFTRLDDARSAGGGTGLGLAIVHELVDGMNGDVAVSDSTGGGARIVVRLPGTAPGIG